MIRLLFAQGVYLGACGSSGGITLVDMDIGTIVSWIQVALWIGAGAKLLFSKPKGKPGKNGNVAWVYTVLLVGLVLSATSLYFNYRPRIVTVEKPVERIVEKPVDKIVERTVTKYVPANCPQPKAASGVVIPPGTTFETSTHAPNSMAAGINNGTMNQGDTTPQFSQGVRRNVPVNGFFETTFNVQVTSNHVFSMQVRATGHYIIDLIRVLKEVPPGVGGSSIFIQDAMSTPTSSTATVQSVSSGRYFITVKTTQEDTIQLAVSN